MMIRVVTPTNPPPEQEKPIVFIGDKTITNATIQGKKYTNTKIITCYQLRNYYTFQKILLHHPTKLYLLIPVSEDHQSPFEQDYNHVHAFSNQPGRQKFNHNSQQEPNQQDIRKSSAKNFQKPLIPEWFFLNPTAQKENSAVCG